MKPRYEVYDWAVRYPKLPYSDFALFTNRWDAVALVALLKINEGREYEIVEVDHTDDPDA